MAITHFQLKLGRFFSKLSLLKSLSIEKNSSCKKVAASTVASRITFLHYEQLCARDMFNQASGENFTMQPTSMASFTHSSQQRPRQSNIFYTHSYSVNMHLDNPNR